jgi:hypothetical protein
LQHRRPFHLYICAGLLVRLWVKDSSRLNCNSEVRNLATALVFTAGTVRPPFSARAREIPSRAARKERRFTPAGVQDGYRSANRALEGAPSQERERERGRRGMGRK